MIGIKEAFELLEQAVATLPPIEVSLLDSQHGILAETVLSPISMPPFRQSNMDGYALALHDGLSYDIVGEIKAGDAHIVALQPGKAVKIFTGAAVPDSAQAVIQIEKVTIHDNHLKLEEAVKPETNVRPKGGQIAAGQIALQKGTVLNAAAIGFLAGLGFDKASIYRKPKVGIVVTGNELVPAGQLLPYGKVYESNAIMLQSALHHAHFEKVTHYQVKDDLESTKAILQQAIAEQDVVMVSGGISVGDYDFVGTALKSLGVETLFYKVNQKPGKPLLVGKIGSKFIFALPGNPAASLTCFYMYVRPTLQKLTGRQVVYGSDSERRLAHDYTVANTRDLFLKATIDGNFVAILPHQDSSMLDSFALANALVCLPNGNYTVSKGEKVDVSIL